MNKKKIVFISDHCMSVSGVGTQARFLMQGLIQTGKYTFRHLGAAIRHEKYDVTKVDDDLIIKPIDGFGNQEMIRQLLIQERPDAILLFTDPRFFGHIFAMHDEIHQVCPIIYNNLWDDSGSYPPTFNKPIYELCDLINCINYPTYDFASKWFPEKTNYIPHAVPAELYFKMPDIEIAKWRLKLLGPERKDHFTALFVGRNARRKRPTDIMEAWKLFLDDLESKHGHRNATLLMHCNPHDMEGPNLMYIMDLFKLHDNVMFSNELIKFEEMNCLYNAADCVVNHSTNEGFGLPVLEAKMAQTPVISTMTGGLIRQIKDHETGYEFGIALPPDLVTVVGNQNVPWIAEDFVSNRTLANAFMKMFEIPKAERDAIGIECKKHADKNYNLPQVIKQWDESLTKLFETWSTQTVERWRHVEL